MSREFITQLYADTPCWLWPVLWIEIYWMQARLAGLPGADDPEDLYEVRLNDWCQLQHITLYSHIETPDPNAWKYGSQMDLGLFATLFYMCPHLRRIPEPQASTRIRQVHTRQSMRFRPAPGMWKTDLESIYLDPG